MRGRPPPRQPRSAGILLVEDSYPLAMDTSLSRSCVRWPLAASVDLERAGAIRKREADLETQAFLGEFHHGLAIKFAGKRLVINLVPKPGTILDAEG
jgi:hypothetical protein